MFSGFAIEKVIIVAVIAAIIIGPERLPQAAEWLGRTARQLRDYVQGARTRVTEEMGEDFQEVDWKKLDPRQYDPRRIIREALLDDAPDVKPVSTPAPTIVKPPRTTPLVARAFSAEEPPPYDDEAT